MVKPGYKQTEVGVIPQEWEVKKLKDIADFIGGGTPSRDKSEYWQGNIPWISSSDISLNTIHSLNINRFITERAINESATQICPKDTILVVSRVGVGKIGIAPTELCTSQDFTNIVLRKNNIEYVARALQPILQSMVNMSQGTSIKGITTDEVKNLAILIPPAEEQDRISEAILNAEKLVASLEKQISKKKAIKQGAMQELLTGKKRLAGFTGEITYKPLRTLCTTFADGDWIESKDQSCDGIRLIQTGNVGNGRYIDKQDKQRFISKATFERLHCLEIFEGDVLISRLPEPAGRACILPASNKRRITAVDCTVVRFSSYNPVLFVAYSQTRQYQEKVDMAMAGSTRQRISRKELGEVLVPVFPTIDEQNAVAAIFSHMDGEIVALEQKLEKYRQVKQGMMQQLLTGKIRIL